MRKVFRKIFFSPFVIINKIILFLNHVKIKSNSPEIRGLIILVNKGTIEFGGNCIINSSKWFNIIGGDTRSSIVVKKDAVLKIGQNFKGSNFAICCHNEINIGNNVMLGGSAKIWDTDFHPLDSKQRNINPNTNYKTKPINIGDNVFIGGFSIILKGVNIGNNSIVGAGSVVRKNIPPNEIWGGNPAVFIKKNDVLI